MTYSDCIPILKRHTVLLSDTTNITIQLLCSILFYYESVRMMTYSTISRVSAHFVNTRVVRLVYVSASCGTRRTRI